MKKGCTNDKKIKARRSVKLPVLNTQAVSNGEIAHSSVSRWRAAALIALTVLMVIHVIQWALMGSTVSPIEPSEAMYTLENGAVNAGFIFFSLAILATLIFGRFVCGWACHVLALQDFCAWLLKKAGLKPRPFRSRLLIFVPLCVALYMFVFPTVYRFFAKPPEQPLIPEFTNHLITTEFWATFPPLFVAVPFLFICGFMTVYFLGSKGFCTYACPYGGFFAVADRVAPGKIRVTDACNQCGHCTATCTSNVLVHKEVAEYGMVVDQGCMKCMDCVSVCPNDALYFGFGKPSFTVTKKIEKRYSLTWPEEIFAALIFFAAFMAVWDVYQLVPMLMALGIATITAFTAMKTWKLLRSADETFYTHTLKSGGRIKKAGWAFIGFSVIWFALNTHSGFVHYYESKGNEAFEKIGVPDELALAQADPREWVNPEAAKNIEDGKRYLNTALGIGLFTNSHALPKLAWIEFLNGNTEQSVALLEKSASYQDGEPRALSLYYKGSILNRLDRQDEALKSLDEALGAAPNLVLAIVEKGESYWSLGKKDEAIAEWVKALKANPRLPLTMSFLSGAAAANGQTKEADAYESLAERFTPTDAHFEWMLGLRLKNVGMDELADKHFQKAKSLNPAFQSR